MKKVPCYPAWPCYQAVLISAGVMILGAGVVSGQDYPNKPIRFVTGEPGGGGDFVARQIAQGISGALGRQVVVDNRGGIISAEVVSRAPPDGYTLLVFGGTFWLAPLLRDKVPYDPVRDFAPITLATTVPNILVVHPSLPVKSVKELIALAKARPKELNCASGTTGATSHLAAELFKTMAEVDIVQIPYKGSGQALSALIGGETQLMFATAGTVTSHIKSGRLRALAVTSAEPSVLTPGLPTMAESGLRGYESASIIGIFAPAKTPEAIIKRVNRECVLFLNTAESKERLFKAGIEVVASSPAELAVTVKSEIARMGKVIQNAGIRAE